MRLGPVICIVALLAANGLVSLGLATECHAQELVQHHEGKDADNGPRALGLVQITDKGKAHIVPIAIMMGGKFYDADSYMADPVPMALDFGVVYEGFRAGVSQGLFTITQPGQLNHEWIAEGTWLPEGAKPKTDTHKYSPPVIDEGGNDDRPVLHRRPGGEADKDESKPAATPATGAPSSSPSPSSPSTIPNSSTPPTTGSTPSNTSSSTTSSPPSSTARSPAAKTSDTAKTSDAAGSKPSDSSATKASNSTASTASPYAQPINDPNRPILRRGKPDENAHHEPFVNFDNPAEAAAASKQAGKEATAAKTAAASSVRTIAAISDAGGPDPRPYTYDLKPAEEAIYRNKMLELAGQQFRAKSQPQAPSKSSASARNARKKTVSAKTAKPDFEDVKLRIFDLSNSNEPVLVLSARTPVPPASASGAQVPQEITLIARTNLEGELQKLFFAQTDSRHLDLSPRMELIDAVDADGDGRGELLFRRTFDSGSAYAIYRVTADGLWPLWEPEP
ncbi:MAG: hypothetical protein WA213_00345 [Terriglobales bacterium]